MNDLTILKIGGNIIDNPVLLKTVLDCFTGWNEYKILIHGGGKIANELMVKLGIEPVMNEGKRITDEKTLEIVTMVYAGWINKNIVSKLQAGNCNAFGITGADGNTISADKRPVKDIDYGYVGDINVQKINTKIITNLLENKIVPVFAPITHDGNGQLLNTNADTIASSLAISMAQDFKVKLIFCFEKRGVLRNNEDSDSFLSVIDENTFLKYKSQGIVHSGMIPKLENAFSAIKLGVSEINICGPGAFSPGKFIGGTNVVLK